MRFNRSASGVADARPASAGIDVDITSQGDREVGRHGEAVPSLFSGDRWVFSRCIRG